MIGLGGGGGGGGNWKELMVELTRLRWLSCHEGGGDSVKKKR